LNEITQESGVSEATSVARYLDILQQMRLITRRVPVTENQSEKSKKGLYQIDDHFLRFWFRYVQPNQSGLDLGLADAILKQRNLPDIDHFVATAFEKASLAFVARLAQVGSFTFLPNRIGGWWDRGTEIDVLAISQIEKASLVGECKWSVNPIGTNVLVALKQKSQILIKDYGIQKVRYILFARSGFTRALEELAKVEGIGLYTADSLVKFI
jgi:uncharacterized protein